MDWTLLIESILTFVSLEKWSFPTFQKTLNKEEKNIGH